MAEKKVMPTDNLPIGKYKKFSELTTVHERVASRRRRSLMTQQQAADYLGIDLTTYRRKEQIGKIECTMLLKIAEMLGEDPCVLLTGKPMEKIVVDGLTSFERQFIEFLRKLPSEKQIKAFNILKDILDEE